MKKEIMVPQRSQGRLMMFEFHPSVGLRVGWLSVDLLSQQSRTSVPLTQHPIFTLTMSSFLRFAGAAAIVLSLGLFASALPLLSVNAKIQAVVGVDAVCAVFHKLVVDLAIEAKIKALLACATIAELEVAVKALVAVLKICADDLLKVGAGVVVAADAKLSIIACVCSIITLLVQVLVQVCLKFGVAATASLCAQIDVCLRLLLVNLGICITGIVELIVKALATVIVTLCAQVKLDLCVALFAKVAGVVV
ncbi:unnamed protein product [Rhizoctonia solani]|uniref:Transmembrane protein n=1 Tax=Rhizoctonia solani TaxID=456999 RepID=A0A8H3GHW5_9AGAM|nr:unnamed protein product [Rhizoctonia solani]